MHTQPVTNFETVTLPAVASAPLDPMTLTDKMRVRIRRQLLGGCLYPRVLQLVAVLDAGTKLPVLLHHQFLHVLVVTIQQRFRQRWRLETLRGGGVASRVRSVASASRTGLVVGTAAQIFCASAAARTASVYR